jgi:hypothetical protein
MTGAQIGYAQLPYEIRVNHSAECRRAIVAVDTFACASPEHCALVAEEFHTGNALEAFCDGAIGSFRGAALDRERRRLEREYDAARAAVAEYRRAVL